MKQIILTILMVALFAFGVSAVQIASPTIGGENQDRIKNVASSFTVTNNNSVAMTGITFSLGSGAENTKYALTVSGPTTIAANTAQTYTINGTIPLDHPGVDANLVENSVKIGTIAITGTASSTETATADVMMQAINQLRIKKARIDCDTKSQSVDDGDRIENLKPGMDCSLEVEIENLFDDNDNNNLKIGDISFDTIDVKLDTSDSDIDLDEDDDISGLDAGDEDSITADLQIDDEADDGTISVDISMSGRDDNGALHGEKLDFRMEIERLSHDVQIRQISLSPASVSNCEASNVKLSTNILNGGKRDEDEASVEVTASDLSFSKKIDNIVLDKDDSTSAAFDIAIPKTAKEGVVRVDVKTYFDTSAPSNSGSVDLTITKCADETTADVTVTQEPKKQTTVVVPQQPVIPAGQTQAAPKKQTSLTEGKAYVAFLAVLSVLIAAAIVALVVVMVRKKRDN
jgi:hypothetical protein